MYSFAHVLLCPFADSSAYSTSLKSLVLLGFGLYMSSFEVRNLASELRILGLNLTLMSEFVYSCHSPVLNQEVEVM